MTPSLKARAIVRFTERPNLFPLAQRLRGKRTGSFCTAETRLCIEGFESSANSFFYNVVRDLRPDLKIAHHTHSVANLKRACRHRVPTLVLYRDPNDAIPSLVCRFRPELDEAILRYVRLYQYVCSIRDDVLLVDFETATSSFEDAIRRLEAQSELSFGTFAPEDVRNRVVRHIERWSENRGKEDEVALPVQERERKKKAVRREMQRRPLFADAQGLYDQLREATDRQRAPSHEG